MFTKKASVLIIILVLFSLNTYAANLTEAYKWLNSQTTTEVYTSSWALLSLNQVKGGNSFLQYLENQKDKQECWPKNSCKAKETALASLALSKAGKNIDKSLEWLKSKQDISLTGDWLLQIKTEDSGQCDITYTTNTQVTKKIKIDKGFITSDKCTTPTTFFNLGNCLESNLLLTKNSLEFDIKCTLSGEISSSYKDAETFYLIDDVTTGSQAKIKINNGNFGSYEDTLITNWALKELNYDLNSLVYLRKNFKEDVKSNSLLYLLTQKQNYIDELSALQKSDKSFGNVIDTALAVLALDDGLHQAQIDQARQWLDLQQSKDFSWNKNTLDTSIVLFSAYPNENIDLKESKTTTPEPEEKSECNQDNSCDVSFGENRLTCPSDCSCGDNICDSTESSFSCSEDCKDKEETPETTSEEPSEETQEEEPEEKSFFLIWLILGVLIFIVIVYFAYKKLSPAFASKFTQKEKPTLIFPKVTHKQQERTEFKGPLNLLQSIAKVKKSKAEDDLEKSLSEARKILGK